MSESCIFCKIIAGEIPSAVVHTDDDVFAFRDINPAAPTHILVVPRKHIPRIAEASDADAISIGTLVLRANDIAAKEGLTDYRLVINNGAGAGQSVFHIHLHILGGRDFSWPPG